MKERSKDLLLIGGMLLPVTDANAAVNVTCAWARASLPHQTTTAAYMTLNSAGGDTLNGADSDAAGMVMLHQTTEKGGMSDMSDMDSLTVPAGKSVALSPGHMHLMVMDLKQPLMAGGKLPLILHFAKAGDLNVTVPVLPISAQGPCP